MPENIPCPNCASTAHYADYSALTTFSGVLVDAGDSVEFAAAAVIDRRGEEEEKLLRYRCSGCAKVLMPFKVDGEWLLRALDPDTADHLRLQSDEKLAYELAQAWEGYTKIADRIQALGLEQMRRLVRSAAPNATHFRLEDHYDGHDEWRLEGVYADPSGTCSTGDDEDALNELEESDAWTEALGAYSIRYSEGKVTLSVDRNPARGK